MNVRQVRKKIKSISNVKKITRAMQLVSAVKMKRAQQLALEGRPYREELESIIVRVLSSTEVSSPLTTVNTEGATKELVIFITSNKGLCGAFNINLFRLILKMKDMENIVFLTIGKKGTGFAASLSREIAADFSAFVPFEAVTAIFELALQSYISKKFSQVSIVYNRFISTLRSEAVKETILPVSFQDLNQDKKYEHEYLTEPAKDILFEGLLKDYVEEKIRGAILNSEATEHSSRMIAMKNATDNANDLIYSLTLLRNKLRQQKITYELLDMITASESVSVS